MLPPKRHSTKRRTGKSEGVLEFAKIIFNILAMTLII